MKTLFIIAGALLALALGIEHRRRAETAQTKADAASMTAAKEMVDAKAEIYALRFLLVDSDPGFKSDMIGCRVMSTSGAALLAEDIIRMTEDCRRRVANERAVAKASAMRAEDDEAKAVQRYPGEPPALRYIEPRETGEKAAAYVKDVMKENGCAFTGGRCSGELRLGDPIGEGVAVRTGQAWCALGDEPCLVKLAKHWCSVEMPSSYRCRKGYDFLAELRGKR